MSDFVVGLGIILGSIIGVIVLGFYNIIPWYYPAGLSVLFILAGLRRKQMAPGRPAQSRRGPAKAAKGKAGKVPPLSAGELLFPLAFLLSVMTVSTVAGSHYAARKEEKPDPVIALGLKRGQQLRLTADVEGALVFPSSGTGDRLLLRVKNTSPDLVIVTYDVACQMVWKNGQSAGTLLWNLIKGNRVGDSIGLPPGYQEMEEMYISSGRPAFEGRVQDLDLNQSQCGIKAAYGYDPVAGKGLRLLYDRAVPPDGVPQFSLRNESGQRYEGDVRLVCIRQGVYQEKSGLDRYYLKDWPNLRVEVPYTHGKAVVANPGETLAVRVIDPFRDRSDPEFSLSKPGEPVGPGPFTCWIR